MSRPDLEFDPLNSGYFFLIGKHFEKSNPIPKLSLYLSIPQIFS